METTLELVSRFDPEYQDQIMSNIVLSGGGSQIRGLADRLRLLRLAGKGTQQHKGIENLV